MEPTALVMRSKKGRKIGSGKINYEQLLKMKFTQGLSNEEIADTFGVTVQAVHGALKRVSRDGLAQIYSRGHQYGEQHVTVQTVLAGLMSDASEILSEVRSSLKEDEIVGERWAIEKRKLLLAIMAELRQQMKMYNEIQSDLFSVESNIEFQRLVVDAIQEASPEVAEKIIAKIRSKQPLRDFIGATGSRRQAAAGSN